MNGYTFDRCSAWDDERDGPTYDLGAGNIDLSTTATVEVSRRRADHVDTPADLTGFRILCSKEGTVVYEGTVRSLRRKTSAGLGLCLSCEPSRLVDD